MKITDSANLAETPRTEGCFPWTPWANVTSCRHPSRASEMQRAFFNENKWVWLSCDFFVHNLSLQPPRSIGWIYNRHIMISYPYCSIIPIQYQQNGFSRKSINPVRFGIQDSATACWSRCCCIFPEGWVFAARKSIKPMIFVWYKPNDGYNHFSQKIRWFSSPKGCQIFTVLLWPPVIHLGIILGNFITNSFCPNMAAFDPRSDEILSKKKLSRYQLGHKKIQLFAASHVMNQPALLDFFYPGDQQLLKLLGWWAQRLWNFTDLPGTPRPTIYKWLFLLDDESNLY